MLLFGQKSLVATGLFIIYVVVTGEIVWNIKKNVNQTLFKLSLGRFPHSCVILLKGKSSEAFLSLTRENKKKALKSWIQSTFSKTSRAYQAQNIFESAGFLPHCACVGPRFQVYLQICISTFRIFWSQNIRGPIPAPFLKHQRR